MPMVLGIFIVVLKRRGFIDIDSSEDKRNLTMWGNQSDRDNVIHSTEVVRTYSEWSENY